MDFENLNQRIGGCGRYQYIVFFLLSITTFKFSGDIRALTFALYVPKFKCSMGSNHSMDNQSLSYKDECQYRISLNSPWMPCSRWTYERDVLSTSFITEFNMVCDRAYLRDLMFSIYFFGNLSSYPLVMLTDRIGRRRIMIIFIYLSIAVSIWQVLAYYLWQQFLLAFLSGFIRILCSNLAFTTLVEIIPTSKMDIAATNFWALYCVCYMLAAVVAFYARTWRAILLMCLAFTIFYFFYFCFVPETPRWMMLNQERERTYKVMSFIAKINRHHLSREDFNEWKPIKQKTGRLFDLFKHKTMIYRLLILSVVGWSFSFAYYGPASDLAFASNNIFITTFVMGLTELPACPIAGYFANKHGRKHSLSLSVGLGILCLIPLPFIEADPSRSIWQPWLKLFMAIGGKLGIVSSWVIYDIIISEIMPTTNRNSAVSLIYLAVGLASMAAPSVHNSSSNWYYAAPCLIYAVMLGISIILVVLFIPETHTLPVPQTMEQAISLKIHKEHEWKAEMNLQADKLGMDNRSRNDP